MPLDKAQFMQPPGAASGPSPIGAVKAGTNIVISPDGTISAAGGGGTGGGIASIYAIDDISNDFNGTRTTFTLKTAGANIPTEVGSSQAFILVGGVLQTPGSSYSISDSVLTFTQAPPAGATFQGRYALGGVGKIIAGSNITVSPTSGIGDVTISSSGGGGGGVSKIIAGSNITVSPTSGLGDVTISATGGGGGAVDSVTGSGLGINVSPTTGNVVVQNTGVTSVSGGRGIAVTSSTGSTQILFTENVIASYDPILWISGVGWGVNGPSGPQSTGLGTFSFTVPDGVNGLAIWLRGRSTVDQSADPGDWPGSSPAVTNMRDPGISMSGSGLNITTGGEVRIQFVCVIQKAGRGQDGIISRWDQATVSGSGSRNVSISVTGSFSGIGSNSGGTQFPQIIVLPYQV